MAKFDLIKTVQSRTGTTDAGAVSLKNIPIGEIVSRKNVRTSDDIDIDDLKASIKTAGLLQPITVYKDGEEHVVVMGHRRLQAYRELYAKEPDRYHSIRCIVTDNKNITVRQLIENVQRADLKPIELYRALKELKGQGLNYKQIAGVIGKAEGYVKNLFAGIKEIEADPDNLDILKKSHDVTLTDFQTVKPIKDKAAKKKLLNAKAEKKITQKQLQHKVKKHMSKGTPTHVAAIELNSKGMAIKISFKDRPTYLKIIGEVKAILKRHNIAIKGK